SRSRRRAQPEFFGLDRRWDESQAGEDLSGRQVALAALAAALAAPDVARDHLTHVPREAGVRRGGESVELRAVAASAAHEEIDGDGFFQGVLEPRDLGVQ